ncbi:beta-glucosidase 6-like [Gossypium hirsutum]|uniref:Beta-glucosidase 6-like n=1 Tax=Gossypium hirsutum TaxID=3635 RepID=A0A1U8KTI5_GOSHI|nr:beta-glucosidase 6-like [Gossypium hirsutum]
MFGDRVKYWTTLNEPDTFTVQGYDVGLEAPGRCSILFHLFCKVGNSTTEPYIVAHNVLLSHATTADIYRKKYKDDDVNVLLSLQNMDDSNNPFIPALKDEKRIKFHNDYLTNLLAAIRGMAIKLSRIVEGHGRMGAGFVLPVFVCYDEEDEDVEVSLLRLPLLV